MFEADKICKSMSVFTVVHYENHMITSLTYTTNYSNTNTVDTSSDPPFLGSAHIFHGRPDYLRTYKEAR